VQNGLRLIVVVTGLRSGKGARRRRQEDSGCGVSQTSNPGSCSRTAGIAQAKVYGGAKGHVPLTAGKEVRLMVPPVRANKIIARVVYSGPVPAPVQQGQKIGMLKVWRGEYRCARGPAAGGGERGCRLHARRAFRRRDRTGARPVPCRFTRL